MARTRAQLKRPAKDEEESASEEEQTDDSQVVREELSDTSEESDVPEDHEQENGSDDSDEFEDEDDDEDDNKQQQEDDDQESSSGGEYEDDEEGEDAETRLNAVGSAKFSSALKKLLGAEEEEEIRAEPAKLFQRKTKLMKMADVEVQEKKQKRKQQDEKNKFDMKSVIKLPEKDPFRINRERDLKRIATRGVVALFNAIGAHQRAAASSGSSKTESKESFLKLLQEKATGGKTSKPADDNEDESDDGEAEIHEPASGWKVLQEDYLENADEIESEGEENKGIELDDEDEEESD